jgi:hypothetical protein
MMTLNELDIAKLAYPFKRDEHGFLQGFVYISEESIGERIEKVDPAWSFNIDEMTALGDSVVVRASMTIKGVTRSNIGGNPIQREKEVKEQKDGKYVGTGKYEPMPLYTQADNGVNAFKSAATDAFKRCARLFGIGRYILGAPKEGVTFDRWLKDETAAAKARLETLQGTTKQVDTTTGVITRPTQAPPESSTSAQEDASPKPVLVDGKPVANVGDAIDKVLEPPVPNSIVVRQVEVKMSRKNEAYLTFQNDDVIVTSFTRDPLRPILDEATIKQLGVIGTHKLPPMRLIYSENGKYKNLETAQLLESA